MPPPDLIARLRAAGCVYAEDEAHVLLTTARTPEELAELTDRRIAGVPLEHVVRWAAFCGLRIAVTPGVFIPRRRTEALVREAAALSPPGAVVVDLCCGSGAVGAALAAAVADRPRETAEPLPARRRRRTGTGTGAGIELYAVDNDPAAVRCARRNLPAGRVYQGDLFAPLPATLRGRVDLLTANTPYVPTGAIGLLPAEARLHEPRSALDGGADGLDVQRRLAADAPSWLAPGGHLLVETSPQQAAVAAEIFASHGLIPRVVPDADLDVTVVIATKPTADQP